VSFPTVLSADTTSTDPRHIERRTELLARANADDVREVAERCILSLGEPIIITPPETGIVMLQVREPVVWERFHLGEVVVTRAAADVSLSPPWSRERVKLAALSGGVAVCTILSFILPNIDVAGSSRRWSTFRRRCRVWSRATSTSGPARSEATWSKRSRWGSAPRSW